MDKSHLKELINKVEQSQEKKDRSYFDYYKSISALSVALIGLLIGLKASPIPNEHAKIAFFITIVFIGLCIFFSLSTRFYEVVAYKDVVVSYKKHLSNYIKNPNDTKLQVDNIGKHWFYKFSEIATFISLILSIVSLICYVYFLEF